MELSACRLPAMRHAAPPNRKLALPSAVFAMLLALGGCGGGGDSGASPPAADGTPTNNGDGAPTNTGDGGQAPNTGGGGQAPSDTPSNNGGSSDAGSGSSPPPFVPSGSHSGKPNADYASIPAARGVVPQYTVLRIPTADVLTLTDMNSSEVVGTSGNTGVRWSPQKGLRTISPTPGREQVYIAAINGAGKALGYYGPYPFTNSPFLWRWDGEIVSIEPPPAAAPDLLLMYDINDNDVVAGLFANGDDRVNERAVIRTPANGWEYIDAQPEEPPWSVATGLNNGGTVVGAFSTGPNGNDEEKFHAFSWTRADGKHDLGVLENSTVDQSSAQSINGRGTVAGWASGPDITSSYPFRVPVIWDPEGQIRALDIDAQGQANDLNNQQWVVGQLGPLADDRAFVWEQSLGVRQLAGLIDNRAIWSDVNLRRAMAVNDYGQIAVNGDQKAYILTPYQLLYSRTDARDDPRPLDGSSFASSDRICVYLAPNFLVNKVRFSLDGTHTLEDDIKPFDLAGTTDDYWCRLLDLSRLEPGQHSATATIQFDPAFQDGFRLASVTRTAHFTIGQ